VRGGGDVQIDVADGNVEGALSLIGNAIESAEQHDLPREVAVLFRHRGTLLESAGRSKEALEAYQAAMIVEDEILSRARIRDLKLSMADRSQDV